MEKQNDSAISKYRASYNVPYALISSELGTLSSVYNAESEQIRKFYQIYREGSAFVSEGTNGDYPAADLKYKKASTLIRKEARFLFGDAPSITLNPMGDSSNVSDADKMSLSGRESALVEILAKNHFSSNLVKAARDCFIGKRVAILSNFDVTFGAKVSFIPSLNFIYERHPSNRDILTKFVGFTKINQAVSSGDSRFFKKKYEAEIQDTGASVVYLEETIHDGNGNLIDTVTERTKILLSRIPVTIILNDGLTGDSEGESEIELLQGYEKWYSKMSNADLDAERKGMNQIKYAIGMTETSLKSIKTGPGAFWDLTPDQDLEHPAAAVGALNDNLVYSDALNSTLDRLEAIMHDELDVPNINLASMKGIVTSGKALKAIYWPLVFRSKEKMKTWGPALESTMYILLEGLDKYPEIKKMYTQDTWTDTPYEIKVEQTIPLPEDEQEERELALMEISHDVISRKSYMKTFLDYTDSEADKELEQIAKEKMLLEQSDGLLDFRLKADTEGDSEESLEDNANEEITKNKE